MLTAGVKILADSPTPEVVLGICFVDADNFYWAGLGCWGHRVSISRTLGSVPEELAYSGSSADVGREVWYKVSVSVSGGTIMLFVDDILQLTMNDLISASGTIGIRTYDSHVAVDYVTVSYYGKMSEPSLRVRGSASSWNLGEYSAETVAETFGMSSSWWVPPESDYSAKMNQVHAMNPKYKALVYRDISSVYDYWADEWSLASNNGWLLKDSSGNYVTWQSSYLVDITNPDYQKWVATKIKSWLVQYPFFDGVSADNGLKASASDWGGDGSDRPMNPRTGTYFTDDEISNGYAQTLSEIISAIGTSKLLLPNGIWNGEAFFENGGNNGYRITLSKVPQLNALGSEGIFFQSYAGWWYDEAKWLKSVDMIVWMQDNFLDKHPERRFNAWVPVDSDVLPPGTTREQLMMWGFCSMLLGAKTDQNTIGFGKGIYKYPSLMTLLQKLQNIDMVEPLGNYYKIPSTSIYARDFAKGKVLVNPTDISYTITLERSYTTFYGSTVSGSLTIDSHTGVILFE
jgi:hypothetical protein